MATSRVTIAAADNQFMKMRIRSATNAIGSAGDDEAGIGIIHLRLIY
jgi:hypothetical protein